MTKQEFMALMGRNYDEHGNEVEEESPFDGEFLKFERVQDKLASRADLHAFVLLDRLVPYVPKSITSRTGEHVYYAYGDIVAAAEHDEIWLDIDLEALAAVITRDQVRDLVRCGVRYSTDHDCLAMFV